MTSAVSASRRRFSQEFKDELRQEVISTSKTIKDVAVAYGVGPKFVHEELVSSGFEVVRTINGVYPRELPSLQTPRWYYLAVRV